MTVDEQSPIVQFDEAPTPNKNPLDDSNLEVTMFEVVIFEEGGMPEGDLTINWAFKRSGLILTDGQSSSIIPYGVIPLVSGDILGLLISLME